MSDKRERRPGELVFVAILLAFSIGALQQAYLISGISEISGPGVFPMLAAGTMILSGIAIFRSTLSKAPASTKHAPVFRRFLTEVTPLRLAVIIALILAYVVTMPKIGFISASAGFLFFSFAYLWRKGIIVSLVLSTACLAMIYVIFRILFQVVLPQGVWWQ